MERTNLFSAFRSLETTVVLPLPEGAEITKSLPQAADLRFALLNVGRLFAKLLDLPLHGHHPANHCGVPHLGP